MAGPEFFQTQMGRAFYEGTMPRLVQAVERLVALQEQQNTSKVSAATLEATDALVEAEKRLTALEMEVEQIKSVIAGIKGDIRDPQG